MSKYKELHAIYSASPAPMIKGYAVNNVFDDLAPEHIGFASEDGRTVTVPPRRFEYFRPKRNYICEEGGRQLANFFCEAVFTSKRSENSGAKDNKTYYSGVLLLPSGKQKAIEAEQVSDIRKTCGLPEAAKSSSLQCEEDIKRYVEGVLAGVKTHTDAILLSFKRYGLEAPSEIDSLSEAIKKAAQSYAEGKVAAYKAEKRAKAEAEAQKEAERKAAQSAGLSMPVYKAEQRAEAERQRAASLEAQLAEALAKIEALTKGKNTPRTKK